MGMLNDLVTRSTRRRVIHERSLRRQKTMSLMVGTGIGAVLGVAAGFLLAPASGTETRKRIGKGFSESVQRMRERVRAARDRIEEDKDDKKKNTGSGTKTKK